LFHLEAYRSLSFAVPLDVPSFVPTCVPVATCGWEAANTRLIASVCGWM
jgi:hypothetical protein